MLAGERQPNVAGALTCGLVKASPQAQLKLLELAELDTELSRLDPRRRTLPENAEFEAAQQRDAELRDELATLEATGSDLTRDQAKAERDVDLVRTRIERDRARLDAGQVSSPKELENLQSEIVSLGRRQGDLEEIVLDLMERRETAEASQREASTSGPGVSGPLSPTLRNRSWSCAREPQPVRSSTHAPSGMRPFSDSQASRSATVSR